MRQWIEERLTYVACVLTAIAIVAWSWWIISYMNDWARTVNQYIIQTDGRLEKIEEQLIRFEYYERQQAATERNA